MADDDAKTAREDGDEEKDKVSELAKGHADNATENMKRNSLMVDDFPDFDPASLEAEDDWGAVFDDDDEHNDIVGGPSSPLSESKAVASVNNNSDNKSADDKDSSNDLNMPPPPPLTQSTSQGSTSSLLSSMPTSFSKIPSIEGLTKNRPPMDHSITRRKKTAGTADRRDSAPPTWHSEAADLPHRQAMVQDM